MRQVIEDTNFANGFLLKHTDGLVTRGYVRKFDLAGTAPAPPRWQLAQWCCNFNLANGGEFVNYDNSVTISDATKTVRTYRNGHLYLELRASMEYQHPRREGEGWPHLLIEQEFAQKPSLSEAKRIVCGMDFTITNFRDDMPARQSIHCAQFQYIFAVSDCNPKSPGYGDYFWFNFSLFDSRYDYPPAFAAQDGGKEENTGKFIYVPNMQAYSPRPVRLGEPQHVEADLLPELGAAYRCARKRGFLPRSEWKDMAVANTNVGWEVTGTFDVGADIARLSLTEE